MRRGIALGTLMVCLAASAAAAQSSGTPEDDYREARALYKRKPPDYTNAARWYRRAAERGHLAAQNDLGWLYQNGWGVPRDLGQAVYWYRRSATGGYANAQVNLGWMNQKGWGVVRDYGEALRLYRLAAAQNDPIAADNIGVMYRDGIGVARDYSESVRWFRKAAAAGYASSETNLGWMYHYGWGVPRDYGEAMKWYRLAAAQGDALAQNNLGVMYRDSLGVSRDLDQALVWFRKGAAGGDARAQQSLRYLESRQRGMAPWANALEGKEVHISLTHRGLLYLSAAVSVRLPAGNSIEVLIPIKFFTDQELRDLGVLQPDGSMAIKDKPRLPYKPMRAPSDAQKRRFFEDHSSSAVAIHWPPYVVTASGLDKQPAGSKDVIREAIERLYER